MALNINRNVTDMFYRYKMPRLIAKVEGKGNGIKTVIVNMSDIAKSLSRPPTYPTKYFGCELGAQTQFDQQNDRYIVNGAHEANKLQDLLDGFIKKFVLCPECENPETNLAVYPKKQQIMQNCIACGHRTTVAMAHKLTTFILKNPPDQDQATQKTSLVKEKSKSKSKKGAKDKETSDNGNGDADNGEGMEFRDNKSSNKEEDDDDEEWGDELTDAAVVARKQGLSNAIKTMTLSDDLEKTEEERANIFHSFIQQRKKENQLTGAEKEKELVVEAERLDIKDKAPLIIVEVLFDTNVLQQIKQFRSLLFRFTNDNPKAKKHLLRGIEKLIGNVHREVLLPKTSHILKQLYDDDVLDEDSILDWSRKVSKKSVTKEVSKELHNKAEPFIKWLKEAEEESSEDEEVLYSNQPVTTPTAQKPKETSEEDDLNIDDI